MFRFPLITFSLFNRFTSYSHTMLLRSRPFHHHVASWPWLSDDLDIQHCSSTICVLFFSYNLFIRWQIYFILTHNVALVETFTLICHIVTFKRPCHWATLTILYLKGPCHVLFQHEHFWKTIQTENQSFTIGPLFRSKPS